MKTPVFSIPMRYFLEVADATDLPLGLYNNPPRVKTDLHWDHLLRIFKHPNYVVHKESTTRVGQVAQVLKARPDYFTGFIYLNPLLGERATNVGIDFCR